MDSMSNIIRLANLGVGAAMVLGGITQIIHMTPQSIIIGCYAIMFGLVTALLEFQIPPQTSRYASFLFSFLGRGVFYIFVATIMFYDKNVPKIIAGSIIGFVGVGYVGLEFVPSIEPPENMRSSEWDGEQV